MYEVLINRIWTKVEARLVAGDGSLVYVDHAGFLCKAPPGDWRPAARDIVAERVGNLIGA